MSISEENYTEFFEELMKVSALEVELKFEPVSLDSIGDIDMTPLEMLQLDPFIV